ncbi:MAG: response regulator transcription factor [Elusimicrobiota bacterium]
MSQKNCKVLIIDDEEDFVNLIKIVLNNADYAVITAYDGETGLKKLEASIPDIIILDLNLPGISGYQVCKKIREKKEYADIPILMLTVRTLEQDHVTGLRCGSDDYMSKPFEPKELLARVRTLLRRAGKHES